MNDRFVVRNMMRAEFDVVVGWAADEGWNPGLGDMDAFYAADPLGYFVGLLDGELVASISAVKYDASFAFLGFYIVRPEHRGKGYGLRLWQHALEQVQADCIGLDGVIDQQDNYQRSGFVLAHRNVRYQTTARGRPPLLTTSIELLEGRRLPQLLEYDRAVSSVSRPEFLRFWLSQPGSHVLVAQDGGRVAGYGAIRPAREGYRIGPLFADTPVIASDLLDSLVSRVRLGSAVHIDVPLANATAVEMARNREMAPAFETARMYAGASPAIAMDKVYGITSLELG